jgi:hypothetical protein
VCVPLNNNNNNTQAQLQSCQSESLMHRSGIASMCDSMSVGTHICECASVHVGVYAGACVYVPTCMHKNTSTFVCSFLNLKGENVTFLSL